MAEKVTLDSPSIDLSEEKWREATRRAQTAKDRLSEDDRAIVAEIGKRLVAEDEQVQRDRAETNTLIRSIPQPSAEVLGRLQRDPDEKAERRGELLESGVWRAEIEATRIKEERAKRAAADARRGQAAQRRHEDVQNKLMPLMRELRTRLRREPRPSEVRDAFLSKWQGDESTFWRIWKAR